MSIAELQDYSGPVIRLMSMTQFRQRCRGGKNPMEETLDETITNSIGMTMKLIPAGGFMMGSPDSEETDIDEKPKHRVEITQSFHLGVYTVTQAEYQKVMETNPSNYEGHDRRPVEQLSWYDAVSFCNKLSKVENLNPFYEINAEEVSIVGGNGYRLPTEAEWEYACRAGTTTRRSFGDDESQMKEYVWHDDNGGGTTHPVGEKRPNPWGLHDMHGNVWEWCWDWYGEYKDSPANDPSGPTQGDFRVLRGGSFCDQSSDVRSAYRDYVHPTYRFSYVGFRLART